MIKGRILFEVEERENKEIGVEKSHTPERYR